MSMLLNRPNWVFDKRCQLYNPTEFSVGELGEAIIQYKQIANSVWVSIESQGTARFFASEYVQGNHAKGRKIQIIRGHYREDISTLSRFIRGHSIYNVDKVDKLLDNNIFYFEAVCYENSIPANYISDGTSFECYDEFANPVVYQ